MAEFAGTNKSFVGKSLDNSQKRTDLRCTAVLRAKHAHRNVQ